MTLTSYPADLLDTTRARAGKRPDDPNADADLREALADSAEAVALWCHRLFLPDGTSGDPVTRTFDALSSALLDVDDLLPSDPAPVVQLNGAALPGTYAVQFLPTNLTTLHPHWSQIRLIEVATGQPVNWNTAALAAPRPPTQDVTVTGVWGYAATVPGAIWRATRRLAVRTYKQGAQNESSGTIGNDEQGVSSAPQGMIDQDSVLVGWLTPYRKGC